MLKWIGISRVGIPHVLTLLISAVKQNAVLRDVLLENEIIAAGCVTHLIKSDSMFYFHFFLEVKSRIILIAL